MTKIKVGVVGLGEVAQVIHLPILQDHSDKFEIAAICDISQELLSALGERYTVPAEHRYTDYNDMASQGDLDAVLVLNSDYEPLNVCTVRPSSGGWLITYTVQQKRRLNETILTGTGKTARMIRRPATDLAFGIATSLPRGAEELGEARPLSLLRLRPTCQQRFATVPRMRHSD